LVVEAYQAYPWEEDLEDAYLEHLVDLVVESLYLEDQEVDASYQGHLEGRVASFLVEVVSSCLFVQEALEVESFLDQELVVVPSFLVEPLEALFQVQVEVFTH
jgi:hypothetical protein